MADVVLERRNRDFIAYKKGHREQWEQGDNERHAVERLVLSRPECQNGRVERDEASYELTGPCWVVHDLLRPSIPKL
jgi:hypothetical protein